MQNGLRRLGTRMGIRNTRKGADDVFEGPYCPPLPTADTIGHQMDRGSARLGTKEFT